MLAVQTDGDVQMLSCGREFRDTRNINSFLPDLHVRGRITEIIKEHAASEYTYRLLYKLLIFISFPFSKIFWIRGRPIVVRNAKKELFFIINKTKINSQE